jgi:hypothetical protein
MALHHQSKMCLMQIYPESLYDTYNCPEHIYCQLQACVHLALLH